MRLTSTSDPDVMKARTLLLSRTEVDLATGCLLWTGGKNDQGYPYCQVRGRTVGAHRFIYAALVGDLAPRAPVHHRCGRPSCVNPHHLQRASTAENNLEMLARRGYAERIAQLEEMAANVDDDLYRRLLALEAVLTELAPHHPLLREA